MWNPLNVYESHVYQLHLLLLLLFFALSLYSVAYWMVCLLQCYTPLLFQVFLRATVWNGRCLSNSVLNSVWKKRPLSWFLFHELVHNANNVPVLAIYYFISSYLLVTDVWSFGMNVCKSQRYQELDCLVLVISISRSLLTAARPEEGFEVKVLASSNGLY